MLNSLSFFSIIPFLSLLFMVATGPLLYPKFWHKFYGYISIGMGVLVLSYYFLVLEERLAPLEALVEYIQFISLIGALYIVASGIVIELATTPGRWKNLAILWLGAMLSNLIGTTGTSMLLIRPYITLNKERIRAYHVVFFIFMVSNIGGALTPIGDPPLFVGFLKGVPFFWTLQHCFAAWFVALALLSVVFYWLESKNQAMVQPPVVKKETMANRSIAIRGRRNIVLLMGLIAAVFLDPTIFGFLPTLTYQGHHFSFIREFILIAILCLSYLWTPKSLYKTNEFTFEPLREVALIFFGIFTTMLPALALIHRLGASSLGQQILVPSSLYWLTGILSSFLDNAPTYLTFLQAGMATKQLTATAYATHATAALKATSLGAVFFGAMTYIGNGPNFMVRAIAEEKGVPMPSFFGYILHYGLCFLFPILVIISLLLSINWV